jgi:protein-S-isoprenylcysteine O-methyltransferase Ste14
MQLTAHRLKQWEFEGRIFISLGIVGGICALSFLAFSDSPPVLVLAGNTLGIAASAALTAGYLCLAVLMMLVSLLRIWGGSILTPARVMAFTVQADAFKTTGPYRIVRNPIYLADFIALGAFALCLPLVGLIMPVLFAVHYNRLILFEEESLGREFGRAFSEYRSRTPRLTPTIRSLWQCRAAISDFAITREGVRHNALFLLFVPGFVVAAMTHEFTHALIIGIPGVVDWAIIHTKIGMKR